MVSFVRRLTLHKVIWRSDWKNVPQLPEGLASLGMIGAQLRVPLKPPGIILLWCSMGFKGALSWSPIMLKDANPSEKNCQIVAVSPA